MWKHIFLFELRYWLRTWMLWIFTGVMSLMIFGAVSTDKVVVGSALQNTLHNAPFVIQNFYAVAGLLTLLMTTAFVNSAATRDFAHNTWQITFSTPVRKRDYLLGRFAGALLVALVPMLGVSIGVIAGGLMPWIEPERWGPIAWHGHWNGILVFAIPNTLFIASILFAVSVLTRSTMASFLAALALLTGYEVAEALMSDLKNENLAMILDPFAIRTFSLMTKYWTVADKNAMALPLTGMMLWNRLLWVSVGLGVLGAACARFRFAERARRGKRGVAAETQERRPDRATPAASVVQGAWFPQMAASISAEVRGIVKTTSFLVILAAALVNVVPSLIFNANQMFGNTALPVTYNILSLIAGSLYIFTIAIIIYFAGMLVWKERDAHVDEVHDALPVPAALMYGSKLAALLAVVVLTQVLAMAAGLITQMAHGYHRFQLGLYVSDLFLFDYSYFAFLAVLAFFFHTVSPNKYLGYFLYIGFLIANVFAWRPLNVSTNMVQFGSRPNVIYSDFFARAPFVKSWTWFTLYWLAFAVMMAAMTILLWRRGRDEGPRPRLRQARTGWAGALRLVTIVSVFAFAALGAGVFYNTKMLNTVRGSKDNERLAADYEKTYKKYQTMPQPRVLAVRYDIDIFPETRSITLRGDQRIGNASGAPLSELHLSLHDEMESEIEVEEARLKLDDKRLHYRIYEFTSPVQPGESRRMRYTVRRTPKGFENEVEALEIVPNGSFFNSGIAPRTGYQSRNELEDPNDRKKYGLPPKDLMPALERGCGELCRKSYLTEHADLVDVETVIGTSPDQIAVAPGSLLGEWSSSGRRYFHYKFDHPSWNFYSFISARYTVARETWNGVSLEVYYLKEHPWNVGKMLNSIRKSLEYCTRNFGPYAHKQARILEFPRIEKFAQAFPGTMPYSESIGFIANLKNPDDIDHVFYIVAHEMAHQWWAHQVLGANMQGATLLSETLAQYSALMVMEKEYGRDMMRKFLEYEMDKYLRNRGSEKLKERPLLRVESNQGYIHYQKGSVILYYLKEMIGEEAVNAALRGLIQRYGYKSPPYPTSWALYDALRERTPAELQYLLKDLFEDITLFSNRTLSAAAAKREDGKYDVTIEVESKKFKADEKGAETEVAVNDFIEIGAFAKPEKGKKYGRTLHRERVRVTEAKRTFTFTVAEVPQKAGIDPFFLLVDRVPDDNLKDVRILR